MALLQIDGLSVDYATGDGPVRAIDGVGLHLDRGEALGVVGESGCGKSTLVKALFRILSDNGSVAAGSVRLDGTDILELSPPDLRTLRWRDMALVPQTAMVSLDPLYRIEHQLRETLADHGVTDRNDVRCRIRDVLALVGISEDRARDYPHQMSGGMRQRLMIALALLLSPKLLVADEPTTGLDFITQAQILRGLVEARAYTSSALLLITHDIAVVWETCDRAAVMYAGTIVEEGSVDLLGAPVHPYTIGLLNAFPAVDSAVDTLVSIPGSPPSLLSPPAGCRFAERCPFARDICRSAAPLLREVAAGHRVACHFAENAAEHRRAARDPETWNGQNESLPV
jgi:oligopeptide/dipeptide ABC transporter ATP-binding protein